MSAIHSQIASQNERYRFTGEQVLAMIEAGMLPNAEEYELLDGELIRMAAKGPIHAYITLGLQERLRDCLPGGLHCRPEQTVEADEHNLPEPDIAIVRGRRGDYRDHVPKGTDLVLAIEVSVSTYDKDRAKLPIYARAGVPTVWILDV